MQTSGGGGEKWHNDGKRRRKQNSIIDYISCADFLVQEGIVQENKLAGWGCGAGGLLVASALNSHPDLFKAAVLKVPFLDVCNTLLHPILPLTPTDYEEFDYSFEAEDFLAIKKYSPKRFPRRCNITKKIQFKKQDMLELIYISSMQGFYFLYRLNMNPKFVDYVYIFSI